MTLDKSQLSYHHFIMILTFSAASYIEKIQNVIDFVMFIL